MDGDMTKKQEQKELERTLKSPKKKRRQEARELRKEFKNSNYLRRDHDDTSNHGQGLGQADREED
jgi:hypothetical protein